MKMSHIPQVYPSVKLKKDKLFRSTPYSTNVNSNVGKIFMKLVDKHFPPTINIL